MLTSFALEGFLAARGPAETVGEIGLPAPKARRRLAATQVSVVKTIGQLLKEMISDLIRLRTAAEFEQATNEAFPKYVELVLAYSRIVSQFVSPETLSSMSRETFSEIEAEIRQSGEASFGSALSDRAIFTVWTLRKTSDLMERLRTHPDVPPDGETHDERLADLFFIHALRARFHIDCIVASMESKTALYPDVLPLIDDGLKSAVNAYALLKQAVDLRLPRLDDEAGVGIEWDEDSRELLDASMGDLKSLED